jgi:hypothetical protein
MTEVTLSGAEIAAGGAETATVEVSEAVTAVVPQKCILQHVLTAVLRPRPHSSQLKEDQLQGLPTETQKILNPILIIKARYDFLAALPSFYYQSLRQK